MDERHEAFEVLGATGAWNRPTGARWAEPGSGQGGASAQHGAVYDEQGDEGDELEQCVGVRASHRALRAQAARGPIDMRRPRGTRRQVDGSYTAPGPPTVTAQAAAEGVFVPPASGDSVARQSAFVVAESASRQAEFAGDGYAVRQSPFMAAGSASQQAAFAVGGFEPVSAPTVPEGFTSSFTAESSVPPCTHDEQGQHVPGSQATSSPYPQGRWLNQHPHRLESDTWPGTLSAGDSYATRSEPPSFRPASPPVLPEPPQFQPPEQFPPPAPIPPPEPLFVPRPSSTQPRPPFGAGALRTGATVLSRAFQASAPPASPALELYPAELRPMLTRHRLRRRRHRTAASMLTGAALAFGVSALRPWAALMPPPSSARDPTVSSTPAHVPVMPSSITVSAPEAPLDG